MVIHPNSQILEQRVQVRAGYFSGDQLFDIGGLSADLIELPLSIKATYAALTRGAPTRPSAKLETLLGITWRDLDTSFLRLLGTEPTSWTDTIRGAESGNNPALKFFNSTLPDVLGDLSYVRNLIVPEFPLFSRLASADYSYNVDAAMRVDFYIPQVAAVIEIDGAQHRVADAAMNDRARDKMLERHGVTTYRISTESLRIKDSEFKRTFSQLRTLLANSEEVAAYNPKAQSRQLRERRDAIKVTAVLRLQLTIMHMLRAGMLT